MCIYQERQVFNIIVFQKLPKHSFSLLNVLFIVICSIYHIDDALGSGVIKLPLRAHIVTAAKVYKVDVASIVVEGVNVEGQGGSGRTEVPAEKLV